MSLSIIKYPQLVKDGYTSRWNCAHLPIVYEIQRQDYVITYTEALLNVVKISLNGAGIAVDALRVAKLIADQQNFSSINLVGAYLFKNPAKHLSDDKAYQAFERFLRQNV